MTDVTVAQLTDEHRRYLLPYFDAKYYLDCYPDIARGGCDPLEHYHAAGWREGRNPSRRFNTAYYLRRHNDVARAGINPLLHFAIAGHLENREFVRPMDTWRERLDSTRPPRVAARDWGRRDGNARPLGQDELLEALATALEGRTFVISVSHDDYTSNTGGVQNLIADEQRASAELRWPYLHVSPAQPLPLLADDRPNGEFSVILRLDRDRIGVTDLASLLHVLARMRAAGSAAEVVIHHFLGHAPEMLKRLLHAAGCRRPVVWAHDFFIACPSINLLRNDVMFCHSPPPDSPACAICSYGEERIDHLRRMQDFFSDVLPIVLAPSEFALQSWLRTSALPHSRAAAVPLGYLLLSASSGTEVGRANRPLRVAHVGARAFHKGWPVFEELVLRLVDDPRYTFLQLGTANGPGMPGCIRHVPVQVTRDTRSAMIDAIAEANVDVVVNWALWPETFCFAAHEALAAGAFIVTSPHAGNVLPTIQASAPDRGCAVPDRDALFALFEGGEVIRKVIGSPRRRGMLMLSDGSIGWLCRNRPGEPAGRERAPLQSPEMAVHV
jgi:hypothetical protein